MSDYFFILICVQGTRARDFSSLAFCIKRPKFEGERNRVYNYTTDFDLKIKS
jgi:hypothetical protein